MIGKWPAKKWQYFLSVRHRRLGIFYEVHRDFRLGCNGRSYKYKVDLYWYKRENAEQLSLKEGECSCLCCQLHTDIWIIDDGTCLKCTQAVLVGIFNIGLEANISRGLAAKYICEIRTEIYLANLALVSQIHGNLR